MYSGLGPQVPLVLVIYYKNLSIHSHSSNHNNSKSHSVVMIKIEDDIILQFLTPKEK